MLAEEENREERDGEVRDEGSDDPEDVRDGVDDLQDGMSTRCEYHRRNQTHLLALSSEDDEGHEEEGDEGEGADEGEEFGVEEALRLEEVESTSSEHSQCQGNTYQGVQSQGLCEGEAKRTNRGRRRHSLRRCCTRW